MGRKKIEMRRIEDKNSRHVTFSKRRKGLIKKARELAVLCDVDVALIVFSAGGGLYEFSSSNRVATILDRYQKRTETKAIVLDRVQVSSPILQNCESEHSLLTCAKQLQMAQRHLEGQDVEQLTVTDLVHLEKQVEGVLRQIRSAKTQVTTESITTLRQQETRLIEENKRLKKEIAAISKDDGNVKEVAIGWSHQTAEEAVRRPPAEAEAEAEEATLQLLWK